MRNVGVTATRHGLSKAQLRAAREALATTAEGDLHHGDCLGGDEQLDVIARKFGWAICVHPPSDDKLRAFVTIRDCDSRSKPRPYLDRNGDIIRESDELWAFPRESAEPPPARGQGTWSTVRAARKKGRRITIFWPDGRITREGGR